ncbi:hypothetical protein LTR95_003365 [Oleoguttula sp. CCFEE 5521]
MTALLLLADDDNCHDDRCTECDADFERRHAANGDVEGGEVAAEEDGEDNGASGDEGIAGHAGSVAAVGNGPNNAIVINSDDNGDASGEVDTTLQFWPDVEHAKHFLTLDDPDETFRIFFVNDDLDLFTNAYFETAIQRMYGLFTRYDPVQSIPSKDTAVAEYRQSQRAERKHIRQMLVTDHQKQRASGRATIVIGKIKRLHFKGIPFSREKLGWDPARYGVNEDLSATARLAAVFEALECLFVAKDIIVASDRSLDDLILNPTRYRDKKLDNFKSNERKARRLAASQAAGQ